MLPQLSSFLTWEIWQDAIRLLDFQIAQKEHNKHYNTVSMYYFEKLGVDVSDVRAKEYFDEKVGNNLFYALEKEFAIFPYLVSKSGLGIRNYKFLSYSMRVLYYAVGIYIFKLSSQFIEDMSCDNKHIKSFYGASLRVNDGILVINKNTIGFKGPYRAFRRQIRKEVDGDNNGKVVISLDIKDFFDDISVPQLLELLLKYIKPSVIREMNFGATAVDQIKFFFEFLSRGNIGIPQYDNDIISSFIGFLYLTFADRYIDDEIRIHRDKVSNYGIIRYVDDIYISLTLKESLSTEKKEDYVESLSARVADMLFYRLGLKLNMKTRLYWLNNIEDIDSLKSSLKKTSSPYQINDDENKSIPQDKLEMIFSEIEELKRSRIDTYFSQDRSLQEEILKEIYDKRVEELMGMRENVERIRCLFANFNFNLVRASPKEICIILIKDKITSDSFRRFLLAKVDLTTFEVGMIIEYLCQTGFNDSDLIAKLRSNVSMQPIVDLFMERYTFFQDSGYYGLDKLQVRKLSKMPHVIEQARLRIMSEILGNYSVALNHLLNEIHAVCLAEEDSTKVSKEYDVNDVSQFLSFKAVPSGIITTIRNLFDRRNINSVSHPGFGNVVMWAVEEQEYQNYRVEVGLCMKAILQDKDTANL